MLLGATAYAVAAAPALHAQPVTLLWLALAPPPLAQVVAWTVEAVRRRPHGVGSSCGVLLAALAAVAFWLQLTGRLTDVLDQIPTLWLVVVARASAASRGAGCSAVVLEAVLLVVPRGARRRPGHRRRPAAAARRAARRDRHPHRRGRSRGRDLARWCASTGPRSGARCRCAAAWWCWPSGPGSSPWPAACRGSRSRCCPAWSPPAARCSSASTPGASTAAARCGARACRSSRGRSSPPARCVLAELLLHRLGRHGRAGLAARRRPDRRRADRDRAAPSLVVTVQVVAASMRWSGQRPFAVDLRSARATPGAAAGDGRLLGPARPQHDAHRPVVLGARPAARPDGLAAGRRAVPGVVDHAAAPRPAPVDRPVERARVVTTVAA